MIKFNNQSEPKKKKKKLKTQLNHIILKWSSKKHKNLST